MRSGAARILAGAFFLLFLVLPGAVGTAQAAVLVSNYDEASHITNASLSSFDHALAFTTGSHAAGYTLTGIKVDFVSSGLTVSVTINASASGEPGSVVGTLTKSSEAGVWTHTGLDLDADTTYFLVFDASTGSGNVKVTTSNAQTGMAGWSLGDGNLYQNRDGSGPWTTWTSSFRVRIDGSAKVTGSAPTFGTSTILNQSYPQNTWIETLRFPGATDGDGTIIYTLEGPGGEGLPAGLAFNGTFRALSGTPTTTQTAKTYTYKATDTDGDFATLTFTIEVTAAKSALISNINQGSSGLTENLSNSDTTDAFTTGSNPDGYTLTSVELRTARGSYGAPVFTVGIYTSASDRPGTLVGTLTGPATVVAGINEFTHSGLDLDANTEYFLFLDSQGASTTGGDTQVRLSHEDTEDSGRASGWSISDDANLYRARASTGPWSQVDGGDNLMFRVNGSAKGVVPTATISAGASPVTEGTAASFTVRLSEAAPAGGLTVSLSVSDASGSDFVASGNEGRKRVTFAQGETSKTYTVPTVNDGNDEPNGSVTVRLLGGTGYTLGSTPSRRASVAIVDNDDPPPGVITGITLTLSPSSVSENGGERTLAATVALVGGTSATATPVTLSFRDVSTSASDFSGRSLPSITIPAGSSSASSNISVTPADDTETEGSETFNVTAGVTVGGRTFSATATVRVIDDETTATVTPIEPKGFPGLENLDRVPRNVRISHSGLVTWDLDTETDPDPDILYFVEWLGEWSPPQRMRPSENIAFRQESDCDSSGSCSAQIEEFNARLHYLVHLNTQDRDSAYCAPPVMARYTPSLAPPVTTSGTATGTALRAPRNVRWEATHDTITITWDAPDDSRHGSPPHTGLRMKREAVDTSETEVVLPRRSPGEDVLLQKGATSFSQSGLIPEQRYRYRLWAEGNGNAIPAKILFTTSSVPPTLPGTTTVINDGTMGLVFSKGNLSLDEGTRQTYTVMLATKPEGKATVVISAEGVGVEVAPESIEFRRKKWNSPQEVTVSGTDDSDTADHVATITHVVSGGGCYDGVSGNVRVRVTDDDEPVETQPSVSPTLQETRPSVSPTPTPPPSPPPPPPPTEDRGAPSGGGEQEAGGEQGAETTQEVCSASGVTDDATLGEFVECAAGKIEASASFGDTLALLEDFREMGTWRNNSTYLVLLTKAGGVYFHATSRTAEDLNWSGLLSCEGEGQVLELQDNGCPIEYENERSGYAYPFSASHVPLVHGEEEFVLLGGFRGTPPERPFMGQPLQGPSTQAGEVDTDGELMEFVEEAERALTEAIEDPDIDPAELRGILRSEGPWREGDDVYVYVLDEETGRVIFDGADRTREQQAGQYAEVLAGENPVSYTDGDKSRRGYAARVEVPVAGEDDRVYIVGSGYDVLDQPEPEPEPVGSDGGGGGCAVGGDGEGAFGLFLLALALILAASPGIRPARRKQK